MKKEKKYLMEERSQLLDLQKTANMQMNLSARLMQRLILGYQDLIYRNAAKGKETLLADMYGGLKITMFKVYKNGNYFVFFDLNTGTKVRYNDKDSFNPIKPESMDLKITNKCYGNGNGLCAMCHECSSPEGKHGNVLNLPFLDTLLPYTEIAIGGGNPLLHPDLIQFLKGLKTRKLIANMTVNQWTFMQGLDYLKSLVDKEMIYGIGVSLTDPNDKFIEAVKEFPNVVIHVINGVVSRESLQKLANNGLKILILGYKEFGRGNEFYVDSGDEINILKEKQ